MTHRSDARVSHVARFGRYATSSALRKPLTYRTHRVDRRLARRRGASGKAEEAIDCTAQVFGPDHLSSSAQMHPPHLTENVVA
eukprot:3680580-Pleurochrysis_carterae.AAC.1